MSLVYKAKMLGNRYKYNTISLLRLNSLQIKIKNQIEQKIDDGTYQFEEVSCCICDGNEFETLSTKDRYGLYMPVVI